MELAETSTGASYCVRAYAPADRAAVRRICADTGFLGKPIDPVFEDRELFADYLTKYYTDREPESALVLEVEGTVKGYILGSRFPERQKRFHAWHNVMLGLRGLWRGLTRPYGPATWRYVRWVIKNGRKETPHTPSRMPHFHINLLPEARNVPQTHALFQACMDYFSGCGETHVYGQMVTFGTRRGERMFNRYGFEVMDKVEVTKYQNIYDGPVFLFTVVKDLKKNPRLYGADLYLKSDA
jgi:hypothetical protein